MNKDVRMIAEAMHHGHPMQVIVSDLYRVHTALNQLSTAIHMNRNAETDQLLSKIRDLADMLIADGAAEDAECRGMSAQENAESSAAAHHRMRKDAFEGAGEELGHGPIKVQLKQNTTIDCYKAGTVQGVRFAKGTIFNCDENVGDYYECDTEEYGGVAVFPDMVTVLHGEENAEHAPDIDHAKADLNKDDKLSAYELARAKAMTRAMASAEQAEHRSNAQHAAIAISLQKAGKKPS